MNEVEKTYPLITGCTQNCIYKNNWKALKEWLEKEKQKIHNPNYLDPLQHDEACFKSFLKLTIDKMNELEGDK